MTFLLSPVLIFCFTVKPLTLRSRITAIFIYFYILYLVPLGAQRATEWWLPFAANRLELRAAGRGSSPSDEDEEHVPLPLPDDDESKLLVKSRTSS